MFKIRVLRTVYAVSAIELVFFNSALGERPQELREGETERQMDGQIDRDRKKERERALKKLCSLKQARARAAGLHASTSGLIDHSHAHT